MVKSRAIVVLVVVMLTVSLVGVGSSFAQSGRGGLTPTPLTPSSVEQASKPDKPNGNQPSRSAAPSSSADEEMVSVIVKLDVDPVSSYEGGVAGLPATSPKTTGASRLDLNSANVQAYQAYVDSVQENFVAAAAKSVTGVQITNRYDLIFGGVSMVIPADQVSALAKLPGVVAVYPDELLQLDTDNSPQFIGAAAAWAQAGGQENAGEGVVVGVLDTGIWPDHPSFSDPDPSGKPYSALAGWNGTTCEFGSAVAGDAPFACNNKLVGAERFMATYDVAFGVGPDEFLSARDDDGHGTHTASTAAGNASVTASIFGVPRGVISGVAPRARVAMYKVCGAAGCYSSDSAAAVQQAIADGVNAINFSISGGGNPYSDAVSLVFLDAYNAGIFVAASAGNAGPGADTTDHREPWVTTVAASTQNRAFQNTATVTADGGASLTLTGASITGGVGPAPVFVPADVQCNSPFAAGSVAGQIVVCKRGTTGRAEKGYNVLQGGAVGMILYNQSTAVTDVETDNHFLPTIHVQYNDGVALLDFIAANTNIQATLTQGAKVSAQGDVMASFSSRGGPGQSLGVSKPDITAPGVQILAGASPLHVDVAGGPQGELFQAIAGTSMSSPHIAGSGALLKSLHPDWTPGQIKSALMLSANTKVVKEDGVTPATPFDDGSGRVDLGKASRVGLTFDETGANYVALQDHLWDANYPSLYVPVMPGRITVERTAHNESRWPAIWWLNVSAPSDVKVNVPHFLFVRGNGNATFKITVDARAVPLGEVRHATIEFKWGHEKLHFPISFVRNQPVVTLSKTCDPASVKKHDTTTCTITATNNSFSAANVNLVDELPDQLDLEQVTGGTKHGDTVKFSGTLAGAQPPTVAVETASYGNGYLGLASLGAPPNVTLSDETIVNFNVDPFVYAGKTYDTIGMVSNGYLVVGGGTSADVQFINQSLPDATPPNNVLAPFWTDLNGSAGGNYYAYTLSDGAGSYWLVFEWENAPNYSDGAPNTFQVWIGLNGVQDISFAYGPSLSQGDAGYLTIGAENEFGNSGANYYVDGVGTWPGPGGDDVLVTAVPGAPGESHVITITAEGEKKGAWTNCALMTGDTFFGTNIACFSGEVTNK
jgi:subtilisin family serine protease